MGRSGDDTVKEATRMCEGVRRERCEPREKLKGRPEECTPEQVRECHGEAREHPCEEKSSQVDFDDARSVKEAAV